jgi:hypothetical protein
VRATGRRRFSGVEQLHSAPVLMYQNGSQVVSDLRDNAFGCDGKVFARIEGAASPERKRDAQSSAVMSGQAS